MRDSREPIHTIARAANRLGVSHTAALELVHSGEALRVVLEP